MTLCFWQFNRNKTWKRTNGMHRGPVY